MISETDLERNREAARMRREAIAAGAGTVLRHIGYVIPAEDTRSLAQIVCDLHLGEEAIAAANEPRNDIPRPQPHRPTGYFVKGAV